MITENKFETVKVFKSPEAFYRYLDRRINAQGYVLVETTPIAKPASNCSPKLSEVLGLIIRKG
jgi:hypothetical protein